MIMSQNIKSEIINLMLKAKQIEYTIPDVMKGLNIEYRETVVIGLTELWKEGKVAIREKGKTKLYHLVE